MAFTDGKSLFWEIGEGPRTYDPAKGLESRLQPLTDAHLDAVLSDARVTLHVANLTTTSLPGPVTLRRVCEVVESLSEPTRVRVAHWGLDYFEVVCGRLCMKFRRH